MTSSRDYFTFDVKLDVTGPDGHEEYLLQRLNSDGSLKTLAGKVIEHRVSIVDQNEFETGETPDEKDTLANCIAAISDFNTFRTITWQKKVGLKLFDIFFPAKDPKGPLGSEFRKVLKRYQRVRLRLWYPVDGTKAKKLLEIPWEYIYYSPNSSIDDGFFLCRNSNFSIVHYCLPGKPTDRINKNELPINTIFLSIDENPEGTFKYFEDRNTHPDRRKRILKFERWEDETELTDLLSAFQNYGVVQCVFHGGDKEIFVKKLDGREAITDNELNEMLSDIENGKVQTVILCSCDNAGASSAPANQLHRVGVPVVIGFTKLILRTQAVRFLEGFTARLADTACSLEEAMVFARNGLISQLESSVNPNLSLDWGAPRMFLASTNSDLVTRDALFDPVNKNLLTRIHDEITNLLNKLTGDSEFPYEQKILEWMKGSQRILYLSGTSGSGKSTQIAHLIDTFVPKDQLIYHLCTVNGDQISDENVNHPLVFVRDSLYPQLENSFEKGLYRSWIEPHYPYLIDNADDAMTQLVIEPLRKARNSGQSKQLILIIDGLDHAQIFEPGYTLLDLLTDYIQPLTEVLRLLITAASDHGEAHDRIRDLLKLEEGRLDQSDYYKQVIELQPDSRTTLNKLGQHINDVFGRGNEYLAILEKAGVQVNYQFVDFVNSIQSPALLEKILRTPPEDRYLERAYQLTWQSIKDQNENRIPILESLLKVLGEAYLPLPEKMLGYLLKTDQIDELLKTLEPFLNAENLKGLNCKHPSIKYFIQALPSAYDGHHLLLQMYLQQSSQGSWDNIDWTKIEYADYAAHYLAEHAYWYYIEGGVENPNLGLDQYLCLMTSPEFRKFRRDPPRNIDATSAMEDIRRALRVFYVKKSMEATRNSQSVEDAWNTANRAMSAVNRIQATYGRSDNPLLADLEFKLCQPREDLLKPLNDFWALYYPTLFAKNSPRSDSRNITTEI
jgi:hypothetical protein